MTVQKMEKTTENDENKYNEVGSYIGNNNTGIYHNPDCFCIGMMNEEHKVVTDNVDAFFRPCAHCKPDLGRQLTLDYIFQLEKHAIPCTDKSLTEFFVETGCKADGNHEGEVLMYPDNHHGMKVHGKPGLWRVYYQCHCGAKTRYFEAVNIKKVKKLIEWDLIERVKYGMVLMDRRPEIQELMAVIK